MKAAPVSCTPRKFKTMISTSIPTQSNTVCGCNDGTAETSAPTPAEIPTAAVRM